MYLLCKRFLIHYTRGRSARRPVVNLEARPCRPTRLSRMFSIRSDPISRLTAALEEDYTIEHELGEGADVSLAGAGHLD